jgi:protocatechuate 3,4-dioxygenase beta subunit
MSASIRVTTRPNPDSVPNMAFQISAIADALAIEWTEETNLPIKQEKLGQAGAVRNVAGPATADLKFGAPARFQGRLVDESGAPIAGAKIHMMRIDHLSAPADGRTRGALGGALLTDCLPEVRTMATTGLDGRFRLEGVSADAIAHFTIAHPDYATMQATAALVDPVTRPPGSRVSTLIPRSGGGLGGKVIVGDIDLTLRPPRSIAVEVVSSTTGKPVANAHVSISAQSAGRARGVGAQRPPDAPTSHASGTTDAAGKVTLRMPPGSYTLLAYAPDRVPPDPPPANSTYYGRQETPIVIKDQAEQSQTVRLAPACKINLEVVEAGTGKPITSQRLLVEMEHGFIPGVTRGAPGQPHCRLAASRRRADLNSADRRRRQSDGLVQPRQRSNAGQTQRPR